MKTLTLSQVFEHLEVLRSKYGDVPIVLWDMDTSWYFPLGLRCFEAQEMEDGSVRVSVGPEGGCGDKTLPAPARRPI